MGDDEDGAFKEFSTEAKNNHDLKVIFLTLQNLCKEFKKSKEEICELFCKVSGDVNKIRKILDPENIKNASIKMPVMWSALEDMALTEPDTSVEFQVLLQEKGWLEIVNRRNFLKVRPVFEREVDKDEGS